MSKEEVFRAALSLPEEARAELADRLYESLGETRDQEEWTGSGGERQRIALPPMREVSSLRFLATKSLLR